MQTIPFEIKLKEKGIKMPQFLIKKSNIQDGMISISNKQDIIHITKVLRKKIGDDIDFAGDDGMSYQAQITTIQKNLLQAKISTKTQNPHRINTNITLFQAIIKSSAQDITIQKATELGTFEICPITTQFCVVNLKDKKDQTQKLEKWQKIALESCKQCKRATPPIIDRILSLKEALSLEYELKIACVERNATATLKQILNSSEKKQNIAIFIGPEGGWSEDEMELFDKYNIQKASIGNMILRAETASISAIAGVVYELG